MGKGGWEVRVYSEDRHLKVYCVSGRSGVFHGSWSLSLCGEETVLKGGSPGTRLG